jgi:hypothetical protein
MNVACSSYPGRYAGGRPIGALDAAISAKRFDKQLGESQLSREALALDVPPQKD